MKPVFEILPEAIFFQQTNLICEINADGFSYVFENDSEKKFHGLSVFNFTTHDIPMQLKEIFNEQPLLAKNYKKVFISYTGDQSALLPEELYRPGENELLLNSLYGDLHDGAIATDLVADKKIYNVHRMPQGLHKALADQFPFAAISHQFSLLIKQEFEGDLLRIIFYSDTFVVSLIKAGELQIIHTYPYKSGADVIYYLMNICNRFNVADIPLRIGGMIEIDSDLHKEISHYFTDITFDKLPGGYEYAKTLTALPPHYFSHLFSLALCV